MFCFVHLNLHAQARANMAVGHDLILEFLTGGLCGPIAWVAEVSESGNNVKILWWKYRQDKGFANTSSTGEVMRQKTAFILQIFHCHTYPFVHTVHGRHPASMCGTSQITKT
jgi:hypothetical protein